MSTRERGVITKESSQVGFIYGYIGRWQWPPPLTEQQQKLILQHRAVCQKYRESKNMCGGERCPLFVPDTSSCNYGKEEYAHIKVEE